jgi:hypothetical protein
MTPGWGLQSQRGSSKNPHESPFRWDRDGAFVGPVGHSRDTWEARNGGDDFGMLDYERSGRGRSGRSRSKSFADHGMSPSPTDWPDWSMGTGGGLDRRSSSPYGHAFGGMHDSPYSGSPYSGSPFPRPKSASGSWPIQERRPEDWRRDFSPRSGISSLMPRRIKSVSTGGMSDLTSF